MDRSITVTYDGGHDIYSYIVELQLRPVQNTDPISTICRLHVIVVYFFNKLQTILSRCRVRSLPRNALHKILLSWLSVQLSQCRPNSSRTLHAERAPFSLKMIIYRMLGCWLRQRFMYAWIMDVYIELFDRSGMHLCTSCRSSGTVVRIVWTKWQMCMPNLSHIYRTAGTARPVDGYKQVSSVYGRSAWLLFPYDKFFDSQTRWLGKYFHEVWEFASALFPLPLLRS